MYQQISSANWPLPIITLEIILLCFVLGYFWDAAKRNNKNSVKVATVSLVVMLALLPVVGIAFEKEASNRAAMEKNILGTQYGRIFLEDVEFDRTAGKYESGNYFNLKFKSGKTETIKYYFSDKTGQPRCFCKMESLMDPKRNPDPDLIVNDRAVMTASINLYQDIYKFRNQDTDFLDPKVINLMSQIMDISNRIRSIHHSTDDFFNHLSYSITLISEASNQSDTEKEAMKKLLELIEEHSKR